jgi:multifunctional 2-oxoglutarate metabolism enzyme
VTEAAGSAGLDVGPNDWLVDEMYEQYLADPASVTEAWRELFADRPEAAAAVPGPAASAAAAVTAPPAPAPVAAVPAGAPPAPSPATPKPSPDPTPPAASSAVVEAAAAAAEATEPEPLRGASARIVENMAASLDVPTATSFREVSAKLLEVNRKVINGYLGRTRGGKVSFTHLIGYAVVRAIADHLPVMNNTYSADPDGKPHVTRNPHVNLGIAVDHQKSDGSRTLLVPVIKAADALDFRGFWGAYEDLIRKVRSGKLSPDDFAGATVSLTNPGTIGTKQSVPRLMPGQGTIVGVGSIDYPASYLGADPATMADLGVSKVVTLTSTYDHRIIQGAESGLFLQKLQELLLGGEGFYDGVFRSLGVPYEAVQWRRDVNPVDREEAMLAKQVAVDTLIRVHRVRGHLIADLDPLAWKEPEMEPELDPATYGLTIWDLDREFLTNGIGGVPRKSLGDILGALRDAYCRTIGIEYMHIQELAEQRWIQQQVEGTHVELGIEDKRHILAKLNAAEAFEEFLATKYVGQKRFGLQGAESAIPILDAVLEAAADEGLDGILMGMAHRGRLNVLTNIVGKSYGEVFREFDGVLDPETTQGSGDVKYHLGQVGKYVSRSGN